MTQKDYIERVSSEYQDRQHFHCLSVDSDLVIDAGRRGSDARYINHSCDPNCTIEKWSVEGDS